MQSLKIWLVGILGSSMLKLLRATVRLRIVDPTGVLKYAESNPIAGAFWHGQQLLIAWLYLDGLPKQTRKPAYVLISKSQDGRFIAKVMGFLGIRSIAGSSSRGGSEALRQINTLLQEGAHVIFTPDGPRGPIYKVKPGVVVAASNAGVPVVATALAASSSWTFGSWDGMFLPKPFSRVLIYVAEKISVPAGLTDAEIEEYQLKVEKALIDATSVAQQMLQKDS